MDDSGKEVLSSFKLENNLQHASNTFVHHRNQKVRPAIVNNTTLIDQLTMGTLPPFVDLLWTLRSNENNSGTTRIIVAVVAVLVLICILFFIGRVLSFRRRTQFNVRGERANNADNDYLMFAYLQTQSPSVVRMRRLANADGLSVQELNEAAPVKAFAKAPDSSGDNVCAVCLEEMEVDAKTRKMPCGHEFDARCIEEWVSKANRCPVCNTHVVEEEDLQKRRIAALEGNVPSPSHTRQRRRRVRGDRGAFELHQGRTPNAQEGLQPEAEDGTENQRGAAGSSEVRLDMTADSQLESELPSRHTEQAEATGPETTRGSSSRSAAVVLPAEV